MATGRARYFWTCTRETTMQPNSSGSASGDRELIKNNSNYKSTCQNRYRLGLEANMTASLSDPASPSTDSVEEALPFSCVVSSLRVLQPPNQHRVCVPSSSSAHIQPVEMTTIPVRDINTRLSWSSSSSSSSSAPRSASHTYNSNTCPNDVHHHVQSRRAGRRGGLCSSTVLTVRIHFLLLLSSVFLLLSHAPGSQRSLSYQMTQNNAFWSMPPNLPKECSQSNDDRSTNHQHYTRSTIGWYPDPVTVDKDTRCGVTSSKKINASQEVLQNHRDKIAIMAKTTITKADAEQVPKWEFSKSGLSSNGNLLNGSAGSKAYVQPEAKTTIAAALPGRRAFMGKWEWGSNASRFRKQTPRDHQHLPGPPIQQPSVEKTLTTRNVSTERDLQFSFPSSSTTDNAKHEMKMTTAMEVPNPFAHLPYYGYASQKELTGRSQRFPSLEQRLQIYMTAWYVPPCRNNTRDRIRVHLVDGRRAHRQSRPMVDFPPPYYLIREAPRSGDQELRLYRVDSRVYVSSHTKDPPNKVVVANASYLPPLIAEFNKVIYLNRTEIYRCQDAYTYCETTAHTVLPALDRIKRRRAFATLDKSNDTTLWPVLMQYGDTEMLRAFNVDLGRMENFPNLPVLKKFRVAYSADEVLKVIHTRTGNSRSNNGSSELNMGKPNPALCNPDANLMYHAKNVDGWTKWQPIIWKEKAKRHFGMLHKIPQFDIPWERKAQKSAIFRGALTGIFGGGITAQEMQSTSDRQKCLKIPRCRLVYVSAHSALIDAKLTKSGGIQMIPDELPEGDDLDGTYDIPMVSMYDETGSMHYRDLLQYKALIMLEGNDVSTGLKWALLSNSVVMMPHPTKTSWAMEELLQPWVHYVPLEPDLTDVEDKMQWVLDHDDQAQSIAHSGTLWMMDLVFHPEAAIEEERVFEDILLRMRRHFVHVSYNKIWEGIDMTNTSI